MQELALPRELRVGVLKRAGLDALRACGVAPGKLRVPAELADKLAKLPRTIAMHNVYSVLEIGYHRWEFLWGPESPAACYSFLSAEELGADLGEHWRAMQPPAEIHLYMQMRQGGMCRHLFYCAWEPAHNL